MNKLISSTGNVAIWDEEDLGSLFMAKEKKKIMIPSSPGDLYVTYSDQEDSDRDENDSHPEFEEDAK